MHRSIFFPTRYKYYGSLTDVKMAYKMTNKHHQEDGRWGHPNLVQICAQPVLLISTFAGLSFGNGLSRQT